MPGTGDVKPDYTRARTRASDCARADPATPALRDHASYNGRHGPASGLPRGGIAPRRGRSPRAAADGARRSWRRPTSPRMPGARDGSVLVLAGPGNNGGDAFVVARRLREAFFDVAVVFRGDPRELPADAGDAHRAFVGAGGSDRAGHSRPRWHGSLIVDGLFGIGLARPLAADYASLVERANGSGVPILALDVPSGLDADTGVARGPTIRAAATATFIALKPGLLTGEGIDFCGDVSDSFARPRARSDGAGDGPSARLEPARRGSARRAGAAQRATCTREPSARSPSLPSRRHAPQAKDRNRCS